MRTSQFALFATTLSIASIAAGCARQATNVDSAESAIDSQSSVSAESDLMVANVDGADATALTALTVDQVAAKIAANVAGRWQPSTCATVTQNGASVTITYNDCTGPRGLIHVTGELDLTVSISVAGVISVQGTATGLEVNKAVLDVDVNATLSTNGTMHTLAVTTVGSGTGPLGNDISHQGDYTVTWDSTTQCRTLMGHWATELTSSVATASRSNDVNLSRCAGGCPTGTMTHHFLGGQSLTVTFDGSATASWSTSGGKSGTVTLSCTP